MVNRLYGRSRQAQRGAVLLLATGAAAAVPARSSTVTCPKVDPKTGAVTPKPANGVDWSGCNLADANLTGANLGAASGNNADFSFANFTDAWLTAARLWKSTVTGTPHAGRLAVSGGTIYATTSSATGGGLVAISASTHKQQWSVKTAAKLNAPAIAGNVVYAVTQNGILFAQNATAGTHLWSANLHDQTSRIDTFHPSAADGVVYALSNTGTAYAFNASTGALLWCHPSDGTLQTAPVIANGILYIGTKSGGVQAFATR